MTDVRVLPSDRSFSVEGDRTLLEAATVAGWHWPSVCGGLAECGTCAFEVEDGGESLSPIGPREQERLNSLPLRRAFPDRGWRLACQARTIGSAPLTIRKICTPPAE